jgi:hypothetical protein
MADGASGAAVVVALTQARAAVQILRGENAGKTLQHTAIVRALEAAGAVEARGGDVHATFHVPAGVSVNDLRVVAFVQRTGDHEIVGATDTRPPSTQDGRPSQ